MTVRIKAKRLVPGRGDVVSDGVVVIEDRQIAFAGPAGSAPETPGAEVTETETVMPGMWDCHGHFFGTYTASIDEIHTTRPQLAAMRCTADAGRALDAGFTSVREVGGFGVFLAQAIAEGQVVGPTIYASGGALSMTAGHGDFHGMDLNAARASMVRFTGEDDIVDGADQARAGVRRMLRLGARVIKIHGSGGVMSQIDDPHLPQFSPAELEAIVDEATRMERVVAAHCHGKRGIMAAVEAGIRTIEHGTYMDDESADAMKEKDVVLVPTRFIVDYLTREGERKGMPDYAKRKMAETAAHHSDGISLAIAKGVKIATGTDIWSTGLWGANGRELQLLVECGMTPLQAIEAATANGPETLGPQAPNAGRLEAGMDADVICVKGDPTTDITVLTDPANVTHVYKGGARVKG
ncbi:MAG: amidohydrolase family protein [Actinobacteria bacterium]|nr:amidohydrolase family protein [Actinomycetota bacterium]